MELHVPYSRSQLGRLQRGALTFEDYLFSLNNFYIGLRGGATIQNVIIPNDYPDEKLRAVHLVTGARSSFEEYFHFYTRLPGAVVLIPTDVMPPEELSYLEQALKAWFEPVFGYSPSVRECTPEKILSSFQQGFFEELPFYPYFPPHDSLKLGNKVRLRKLLEEEITTGTKSLVTPGKILNYRHDPATVLDFIKDYRKAVIQTPDGVGGFGTFVVEHFEKQAKPFKISHRASSEILTSDEFHNFLSSNLAAEEIIVMQFIENHVPISFGCVLGSDGRYHLGPVRKQLVQGASYRGVLVGVDEVLRQASHEIGEFWIKIQKFLDSHVHNLKAGDPSIKLPPVIGFDVMLADRVYITECNARCTAATPLEMTLCHLGLYQDIVAGKLSACQLDHVKLHVDSRELHEISSEIQGRLSQFGYPIVFLPSLKPGEHLNQETLRDVCNNAIIAIPATALNPRTGKLSLQFVGEPEEIESFLTELTDHWKNLCPEI